eukprot:TRINITY_DN2311_c0_g2_i1.p1 TRINITY_DN2311_c0_g2~~TRINITY_DN2311_c0_g2_i1.p1  ORF type:complete len:380 (+),score=84.62 TRINITY_DN2311_c0_g2_i1:1658-2797(+)
MCDAVSLMLVPTCPSGLAELLRNFCANIRDLVVVGLQEIAASECDAKKSPASTWSSVILHNLDKLEAEYVQVHEESMGGLYIALYAKANLNSCFTDIKSGKVDTSPAKTQESGTGATIISFKFMETPFTFINCRLSSKKEDYRRRFEEIREICCTSEDNNTEAVKFIFGDLNFRVELDKAASTSMAQQENFAAMFRRDQLWGKFHQFNFLPALEEAPVDFAPTYKFVRGTSDYDLQRAPAWRGRILWLSRRVKCDSYGAATAVKLSTHKPVRGVYRVALKSEHCRQRTEEEVKGEVKEPASVKEEPLSTNKSENDLELEVKSKSEFNTAESSFPKLTESHSESANEVSLSDFLISDFYKVGKGRGENKKVESGGKAVSE